jgi:nicotinate dehydrogenase subunit B
MSTAANPVAHPATSPLPPGPGWPAALQLNPRLSSWVRLRDGVAEVRTGKVEIGQGIVTALAQIAAEELGLAPQRIRMQPASTAASPDEGITSGSRSIYEGGAALRQACALARALLVDAAASRLDADPATLSVADGAILRNGTPTGLDYWSLPHAALLDTDIRHGSPLQPVQGSRVVGHDVPRLDLPAKVAGRPAFVHDVVLPGMLYGRVVRSPDGRNVLASLDLAAIGAMPGVVAVLRDGSFVGVVAQREEQAVKARARALELATWQPRDHLTDDANLHAWLQAQPAVEQRIDDAPDPAAAARANQRHHARFTKPPIAHAAMAPSCAVARFDDAGRLEVWSHSQSIHLQRHELSRALRLPIDHVTVHHAEGPGCFGHNGADDVPLDAALLSRSVGGRPVQVQWMRDDEFAWEPYGPAMVVEIDASLDAQGRIVDWSFEAWSNGHLSRPGAAREGGPVSALLAAWTLQEPMPRAPQLDPPMAHRIAHGGILRNASSAIYQLPNQRVAAHRVQALPLRASSLRGLGAYANIFAIESFMDELAERAGADPLAFRLQHLQDPRARAVLERAAQEAGWQAGQASDGTRGRGLAVAQYGNHHGYFGVVVDLRVDPDLRGSGQPAAKDAKGTQRTRKNSLKVSLAIVDLATRSPRPASFDRPGNLGFPFASFANPSRPSRPVPAPAFTRISVELIVGNELPDVVGEAIDVGMVGGEVPMASLVVRRIASFQLVLCASTGYLQQHGVPQSLDDLRRHRCVNLRHHRTGKNLPWTFQRGDEVVTLDLPAAITVNDTESHRRAVLSGSGIGQLASFFVAPHVRSGQLHRLDHLNHVSTPIGLYLYLPTRLHMPRKNRLLADFLFDELSGHPDLQADAPARVPARPRRVA